jgi:hypothetical protein
LIAVTTSALDVPSIRAGIALAFSTWLKNEQMERTQPLRPRITHKESGTGAK